jgi:chromate transporter
MWRGGGKAADAVAVAAAPAEQPVPAQVGAAGGGGESAAPASAAATTTTTTLRQRNVAGGSGNDIEAPSSAAALGPAAAPGTDGPSAAGGGGAATTNGNGVEGGGGGGGGGNDDGGGAKAAATADSSDQQKEQQAAEDSAPFRDISYAEIAKEYSILGWTAFGGPAAHIGLFERRLVQKRRWVSSPIFAELFALCQCLPGPASTQLSFAMGTVKRGTRGGLLSGVLFQYPGAFIMTGVGVFAANLLANPVPWLDALAAGVGAVGIALVAAAAKSMASKQCAGPLLASICAASAVVAYYWPKPYTFPSLIFAGGLVTLAYSYARKQSVSATAPDEDASVRSHGLSPVAGVLVLALWLSALVATLVAVGVLPGKGPFLLQVWTVFFRTGSIIYGGGQVVLPMLYTDVVQQTCTDVVTPAAAVAPPPPPPAAPGAPPAPPPPSAAPTEPTTTRTCVDNPDTWVTSRQFYAGLGVVQAMPGPLFNFSSYLGAVIAMGRGYSFAAGAALAWFGLFMPGIMIIFGILPFWGKFRRWQPYRRALPGLNAAGVGLIVTSVFSLTVGALRDSPFPQTSLCLGILAFTAVDQLKVFEPAVVIVGGGLGVAAWAAGMK